MGTLRFKENGTVYPIPQILDIAPAMLLDEHREVYRVSIGNINATPDEKKLYQIVFDLLESKQQKGFIDPIILCEGDMCVDTGIAFIEKSETNFGVLYDIEFPLNAKFFTEKIEKEKKKNASRRTVTSKGKTTKRNSKTTNTSKP